MTANNAPVYVEAGVNLRNLDEYQGMSLKEIQDEKAAENKKYAKARKKAEKAAVANNAKIRKNIQLIKSNKMYTCGFFRLKVGSSTATLYDNFYGAVEDQLVYIDKTNTSKKYVGKYTVEIITDIKKVKKELANASILKN